VLIAVKLDHEPRVAAEEIGNVRTDRTDGGTWRC
jgi:hypothetical protein